MYANQTAFDQPDSRRMALGVDLRPANAITDAQGRVLAHKQTGGMLSPTRHVLNTGDALFRFGSRTAGPVKVAGGAWWMDQAAFDQLFRFAQVWELSVGMAMRILCLVPPEWSDATLLIRARVAQPLLAWRGLANSVVTPAAGGGSVKMPHQNDIAARRLHQLFVPGLAALPADRPGVRVEQDYPLDEAAGKRGFIYL
jgi:hypothetical protein